MTKLRDDDSLIVEMAVLLTELLALLDVESGGMGSEMWVQEVEAAEARVEAILGQLWLRDKKLCP